MPQVKEIRRGYSPRDGRLKTHAVSRHCILEEGCVDQNGHIIGRSDASQFPAYVKPGDITRIKKEVADAVCNDSSRIQSITVTGGASRVTMVVDRFGIHTVGAFVREANVISVFPEQATGGHSLEDGAGRRFKKHQKKAGS